MLVITDDGRGWDGEEEGPPRKAGDLCDGHKNEGGWGKLILRTL